jgi:hypothetical protein
VTTLVIVLVLLAVAALAVASVPLMLRSTRRHQLAGGPRRPALDSPARAWVERGERVVRELDALLAEHGAWQAVSVDATEVVAELRLTAGQVAEVDHALAQIRDPALPAAGRLRETRAALLARMAGAVAGLEQARAELAELIAATAVAAPDPEPAARLTSRLVGLREGLAEVRGLADPEIGSGNS